MSLTRTEFYRADLLSVRYVACRSAPSDLSDVEYSEAPELVMPLKGAFVGHFSPGHRVLAEPNIALLFPPGRGYKVSHPAGGKDDCLVFEFSQPDFLEILVASSLAMAAICAKSGRTLCSRLLPSPPVTCCGAAWREGSRTRSKSKRPELLCYTMFCGALGEKPTNHISRQLSAWYAHDSARSTRGERRLVALYYLPRQDAGLCLTDKPRDSK